MKNQQDTITLETLDDYEAPALTVIGQARAVVLGLPGSGFDGLYGITEPEFEFAEDARD